MRLSKSTVLSTELADLDVRNDEGETLYNVVLEQGHYLLAYH